MQLQRDRKGRFEARFAQVHATTLRGKKQKISSRRLQFDIIRIQSFVDVLSDSA
jgi:hypothetical protein